MMRSTFLFTLASTASANLGVLLEQTDVLQQASDDTWATAAERYQIQSTNITYNIGLTKARIQEYEIEKQTAANTAEREESAANHHQAQANDIANQLAATETDLSMLNRQISQTESDFNQFKGEYEDNIAVIEKTIEYNQDKSDAASCVPKKTTVNGLTAAANFDRSQCTAIQGETDCEAEESTSTNDGDFKVCVWTRPHQLNKVQKMLHTLLDKFRTERLQAINDNLKWSHTSQLQHLSLEQMVTSLNSQQEEVEDLQSTATEDGAAARFTQRTALANLRSEEEVLRLFEVDLVEEKRRYEAAQAEKKRVDTSIKDMVELIKGSMEMAGAEPSCMSYNPDDEDHCAGKAEGLCEADTLCHFVSGAMLFVQLDTVNKMAPDTVPRLHALELLHKAATHFQEDALLAMLQQGTSSKKRGSGACVAEDGELKIDDGQYSAPVYNGSDACYYYGDLQAFNSEGQENSMCFGYPSTGYANCGEWYCKTAQGNLNGKCKWDDSAVSPGAAEQNPAPTPANSTAPDYTADNTMICNAVETLIEARVGCDLADPNCLLTNQSSWYCRGNKCSSANSDSQMNSDCAAHRSLYQCDQDTGNECKVDEAQTCEADTHNLEDEKDYLQQRIDTLNDEVSEYTNALATKEADVDTANKCFTQQTKLIADSTIFIESARTVFAEETARNQAIKDSMSKLASEVMKAFGSESTVDGTTANTILSAGQAQEAVAMNKLTTLQDNMNRDEDDFARDLETFKSRAAECETEKQVNLALISGIENNLHATNRQMANTIRVHAKTQQVHADMEQACLGGAGELTVCTNAYSQSVEDIQNAWHILGCEGTTASTTASSGNAP